MYVLAAHITLGDYSFKRVHEVEIERSVDSISDTAVIKMPVSALFGNNQTGFERKRLDQVIKSGDPVTIRLSYVGVIDTQEFTGYVTSVSAGFPVTEIRCEDAVYHIRRKRVNKNFGATNLRAVLEEVVSDTGISIAGDIPDVQFDSFKLKDVNGAQALQKIKDDYGLSIYLDDDGRLFAGLRQQKGFGSEVTYHLRQNIADADLKYKAADDVLLKVKVIGIKKDGSRVEVHVGDESGEQRTIHIYNVSDKNRLRDIGEAELDDLKYDGYDGEVTGFLAPFADRGMTARIYDPAYPDREGRYFIPSVTIRYGTGGGRRIVKLSNKVA